MNFRAKTLGFVKVLFLISVPFFLLYFALQAWAQFGGELGVVSGTVRWGTIAPSSFYPAAYLDYQIEARNISTGFTVGVGIGQTGDFSTGANLPTGTYEVSVMNWHLALDPSGKVVTQTVDVIEGQTAVVNFDLSLSLGLARGNLIVDGVPSGGYVRFCPPADPCPADASWGTYNFDVSGFSVPLWPGEYIARGITYEFQDAGLVQATVLAGQIVEGISFSFITPPPPPLGTISATLRWGTEVDFYHSYNPDYVVMIFDSSNNFVDQFSYPYTHSGLLNPGTYNVIAYVGSVSYAKIVEIVDGTVVVDFDFSTLTGLVRGNLIVDGQPSGGQVQFCLPSDPCTANFSESSGPYSGFGDEGFARPLVPGDYRVHVITSDGHDAGIVPVVAVVGQTTESGTFSLLLNPGSISGTMQWGPVAPNSYYEYWIEVRNDEFGINRWVRIWENNPSVMPNPLTFSFGDLPAGTYSVSLINWNLATSVSGAFYTQVANVVSGQTTAVDFDLTAIIGFVRGNLIINGSAANGVVVFCPMSSPCTDPWNHSQSRYSFGVNGFLEALLPGDYWVHVFSEYGVEMGMLQVTVVAGEVTDLTIAPNDTPAANAGGPYSVVEGGSVGLAGSGDDPNGDPLTYAWDLDNNGTFETPGQNVTFSAASLDGPSSQIVVLQVCDDKDACATDQTSVDITNVAPTATFANTSGTINEGQSAILSFTDQFDPSVADTEAGFRYSYDCTNDGVLELEDSSDATFSCSYPAAGTFTALGRIKDKDSGFTDYIVPVSVQHIPEITSLSPAQVWVGLRNSYNVGIRFDFLAEVYEGSSLIGSGELNSAPGGGRGFSRARLNSIPLTLFAPVPVQAGDQLSIRIYVRNACSGSRRRSGIARLWYNDSEANSHFGATVDSVTNDYYLLNNFLLDLNPGSGPKRTIDVAAGSRCSPFKPFGTWSITL